MLSFLSWLSLGHFFYSRSSTFLPHAALRPCFISLITVLTSRHMSYRTQSSSIRGIVRCSFAESLTSVPWVRWSNICIGCFPSWRLEGEKGIHTFRKCSKLKAKGKAFLRGGIQWHVYGKMTAETNWSISFWLYYHHKDKCSNRSWSWDACIRQMWLAALADSKWENMKLVQTSMSWLELGIFSLISILRN